MNDMKKRNSPDTTAPVPVSPGIFLGADFMKSKRKPTREERELAEFFKSMFKQELG